MTRGNPKDRWGIRESASILDMVVNYSTLGSESTLDDVYDSSISINSTGERMEYFVKDLLAGSLDKESKEDKITEHKKYLSWLGSQNHPPDLMIRDDVAVEVKKSRGKHSKLQLNSSTPRTHLKPDMPRVNTDCANCEDWGEKDMVYVLGSSVTKSDVGFMWVVYGECWCDKNEEYNSVTNSIESAIEDSLPDDVTLDMSGNEIAKVKDVGDGMGAELRVRPMWSIGHPAKIFSQYVNNYEEKIDNGQPLFLVMPDDKFESTNEQKKAELAESDTITITKVKEENCHIIEVTI